MLVTELSIEDLKVHILAVIDESHEKEVKAGVIGEDYPPGLCGEGLVEEILSRLGDLETGRSVCVETLDKALDPLCREKILVSDGKPTHFSRLENLKAWYDKYSADNWQYVRVGENEGCGW